MQIKIGQNVWSQSPKLFFFASFYQKFYHTVTDPLPINGPTLKIDCNKINSSGKNSLKSSHWISIQHPIFLHWRHIHKARHHITKESLRNCLQLHRHFRPKNKTEFLQITLPKIHLSSQHHQCSSIWSSALYTTTLLTITIRGRGRWWRRRRSKGKWRVIEEMLNCGNWWW